MEYFRFLLLLLVTAGLVKSDSEEDDENNWSVQVVMGDDVTLYCNDSRAMIQPGETGRWTVPSGEVLADNHNDTYFRVQNWNGIQGYKLRVNKVTESNQGVYLCVIYTGNTPRIEVVRLINYSGPKYLNGIDRYEKHILIAFVATAVFVGILLILCLTYRFRYRSPEEKMFAHQFIEESDESTARKSRTIADSVRAPGSGGAYDNPTKHTKL